MNQPEKPRERHPDEYLKDLNPDDFLQKEAEESVSYTLYDFKEAHDWYPDLSSEDLKSVALLPSGTPLDQGETYLSLHDRRPYEFVASGGQMVEPGEWIADKRLVDYRLRNGLLAKKSKEA